NGKSIDSDSNKLSDSDSNKLVDSDNAKSVDNDNGKTVGCGRSKSGGKEKKKSTPVRPMPANAKKQGMKFLMLNTIVPFFLIILLIAVVQISLKVQIHEYSSESACTAAEKLATMQILTTEQSEDYYATKFTIGYLDGNKNLIMTKDYGNRFSDEAAREFEKKRIETKCGSMARFNGKHYAIGLAEIKNANDINAKYVVVLFDLATINDMIYIKILTTVSIMFVIVFLTQILVAWFGTRLQIKPYVEQLEKNQQLVSDISHEFNTPLAIINANASNVIANSQAKVEEVSDQLVVILDESNSLKRMVKDMLFLSRNDRGTMVIAKKMCDISDKISGIIEPFAMQCEAENKQFVVEIQPNVCAVTDGDKIRQAAIIFMDNAVKYTKENEKITLKLEQKPGKIILSVADTGKGVKEDQIEKLFERFYRVDESRGDSKIGGVGLGLSIAKAIAENLGGRVVIEQNKPKGFKIQLEIKSQL
ncbi:MAG: HAMP domain-containing sensor histidine kinase, partial [Clostridia bacterium]